MTRLVAALALLVSSSVLWPQGEEGHRTDQTGVAAPRAARPVPLVRVSPSHPSRSRVVPARPIPPRRDTLNVTCYVATGHRTASGVWPRAGMAAGNRWPFGTRLRVQGVGVVTITDRIGHGSELDLFMTSLHACRQFGRRHLAVEVVR